MPRKAYTPKELRELAAEPYDVFHPHLLDTMRGALRFCADVIDAANEALSTHAGAAAAAEPSDAEVADFVERTVGLWREYDRADVLKLTKAALTSAPAVPEAIKDLQIRRAAEDLWQRKGVKISDDDAIELVREVLKGVQPGERGEG